MCIDLGAGRYGAPIPDLQGPAGTVENAARSDPRMTSHPDIAQYEHIVIHRRALAKASGGSIIAPLAQQISNRNPSIESFLLARTEDCQKCSDVRQPFVDVLL